jgi:hypothetical protein
MAAGDIKLAYGSSAALTITLASLAESATHVTGRESTAVANSSNYQDELVGGKITTGTSPTAGEEIRVWVYAAVEDTPIYPDELDGTDSGETISSENIRNACLRLAEVISVDSTSDETYWFGPISVASLFGGVMPTHWGVFVTHSTDVNLNSTGSNHAIYHTPVYSTVAQ